MTARHAERIADLPQYLRLPNDQRVESRRDSEQVLDCLVLLQLVEVGADTQ